MDFKTKFTTILQERGNATNKRATDLETAVNSSNIGRHKKELDAAVKLIKDDIKILKALPLNPGDDLY
jgi:hypothetical protein